MTGATGFVGGAVCRAFEHAGISYKRALRRAEKAGGHGTHDASADVMVGDIGPETCWRGALSNVSAVVHLAARTHIVRETANDPMSVSV